MLPMKRNCEGFLRRGFSHFVIVEPQWWCLLYSAIYSKVVSYSKWKVKMHQAWEFSIEPRISEGNIYWLGKKKGFVIKVNSLRKSGGYSQSPGPLAVFFTDAYPLVSKDEAASKWENQGFRNLPTFRNWTKLTLNFLKRHVFCLQEGKTLLSFTLTMKDLL